MSGVRPSAGLNLFYATRDGQARRIADHIAARLAESCVPVFCRDLATAFPSAADIAAAQVIAVVAAVRYGRHLAEAERFFALYQNCPSQAPLIFVSVSLSARKPGRDQYLRRTISRHRLQPALAQAVAGRLDYPRYDWLDRKIIRLIMKLTGGPTDPRCQMEYTSWPAVDAIANDVAAICREVSHGGSAQPQSAYFNEA